MKDTTIKMFGDTYTEFNVLLVNLSEMNMKHVNNSEQKKLYDLFRFLVNKGYKQEAADLWNDMITENFIIKSL